MTTTINYNDWETAYHAWEAMRQLLNAKGYPEVLEADAGYHPWNSAGESRLWRPSCAGMFRAPGRAGRGGRRRAPAELPKRTLPLGPHGYQVLQTLENLACYKFVVLDEASKLRRDAWRHVIPYGVEPRPISAVLIRRYRLARPAWSGAPACRTSSTLLPTNPPAD
jgi:IS5 family transposase